MVQTSSQSTVNKIEMRLRGKGRGSIVFQQDYADCGTPSAVKSTFHRMYTDGMLVRLAHGIYYYPKEDKEYGLGIIYPSVEDIAQAIAKRDKAKIVPMGAYALALFSCITIRPAAARRHRTSLFPCSWKKPPELSASTCWNILSSWAMPTAG